MTLLRITLGTLIALLVVSTFLGFAAGDVARHAWDKHSRQAGGHSVDPPRGAWKTTPGVMVPRQPPVILALFGQSSIDRPMMTLSAALRPPFVPPRV
jgi:hypothetical protein